MKFDVFLDSGVSVDVEDDPDNDSDGNPRPSTDNDAYAAFRAKARDAFIAMLESDNFDLAYDREGHA